LLTLYEVLVLDQQKNIGTMPHMLMGKKSAKAYAPNAARFFIKPNLRFLPPVLQRYSNQPTFTHMLPR
jgi:hypothetical protein